MARPRTQSDPIFFRIPDDLIGQLDQLRGAQSRGAWVKERIVEMLRDARPASGETPPPTVPSSFCAHPRSEPFGKRRRCNVCKQVFDT